MSKWAWLLATLLLACSTVPNESRKIRSVRAIGLEADTLVENLERSLEANIIKFCEQKWTPKPPYPGYPNNPFLKDMEQCKNQQRLSVREIFNYASLFLVDEFRKIVIKCMDEHAERGLTDWMFTYMCMHNSLRLGRSVNASD